MKINRSYVSSNNTYNVNNPQYIVIHNTDNFRAGADALAHAKAQFNRNLSTSVHYYTDDNDTVYQTTAHDHGCWHVGVNYGGRLFGPVNNKNSIGVEMCVQAGYDFNKAFANTVAFVCQLMEETGIPDERVLQHYDVCAKNCPSQIRGKGMWEEFKRQIQSGGSGDNEAKSSYSNIMGNTIAAAEQMQEYIKQKNLQATRSVLEMIPLYLSEGAEEGVRGDIAFAQSCLETGDFGFTQSAVTLEQNNFAGMGVVQNGMKGLSFDTPQLGIRCQIQHLKAYACTDALVNKNIDPRFQYVTRGSAPYVEWLGIQENPQGKGWAAGAGYGSKILSILKNIIEESGSAVPASGADQRINPLSGYVNVFYKGKDGLNMRTAPCMGNNVSQVVYDGIYTVVGISADGKWYKLKSGHFITTGKDYVQFMESLPAMSSYMIKVTIPDLNIRKGPGTNYAKTGRFTGTGVFTIVEESGGQGATKWGLLKPYQKNRDGWISLDYVTRI
ncbi:mannosyl-glycoprotein endo-beta-N-acetylglucosaminidase [Lachnotalea glycerini]|uniref:N-acetylmuramoyl-L-alanine amidase n=1 Tax=Lachnotalea glycerini TaxID=1763509 RepID=A0A318EQP3_9FIRM|nr:N-acetylmuramoyl-L-alanine amidase [Lachnotalea glycerini]PXV93795.1 mannosyl-glycoprotein endo-beta-N-acetylglucosaminidase [Lachnotalea glycerini]